MMIRLVLIIKLITRKILYIWEQNIHVNIKSYGRGMDVNSGYYMTTVYLPPTVQL